MEVFVSGLWVDMDFRSVLSLIANGFSYRFSWTGDHEDKMLVTVTRTNKQTGSHGSGIFGVLVSMDTTPFKCITMERAGVEIPVGSYPIKWAWSDHFQQFMPHIMNVPGRTGIEQHWANYPVELEGCQAMGTLEEMANDCIDQSKDAWKAYCTLIINEPNVMLKVVEDYA